MDVFPGAAGEKGEGKSESDWKAPSAVERVKEKNDAVVYKHHHHHHHESHGADETIEQDTPVEDVRAPNVFERAKEEIEAVVQHFHDKKNAHQHSENESEDHGCWTRIGHKLERFCGSHNSTQNAT
jgi:hypothetical protein